MAKNRLGGNMKCNCMGQIKACCFIKNKQAALERKTEILTM